MSSPSEPSPSWNNPPFGAVVEVCSLTNLHLRGTEGHSRVSDSLESLRLPKGFQRGTGAGAEGGEGRNSLQLLLTFKNGTRQWLGTLGRVPLPKPPPSGPTVTPLSHTPGLNLSLSIPLHLFDAEVGVADARSMISPISSIESTRFLRNLHEASSPSPQILPHST